MCGLLEWRKIVFGPILQWLSGFLLWILRRNTNHVVLYSEGTPHISSSCLSSRVLNQASLFITAPLLSLTTHYIAHCSLHWNQQQPALAKLPFTILLQFTVALQPVSAAHLSSISSLTADQTEHHEPLHYTAVSCPVLHQATPAPSRPALSNMVAEPATNQFS